MAKKNADGTDASPDIPPPTGRALSPADASPHDPNPSMGMTHPASLQPQAKGPAKFGLATREFKDGVAKEVVRWVDGDGNPVEDAPKDAPETPNP